MIAVFIAGASASGKTSLIKQISAKLKGRVISEETRKKMSEARKKLWAEKKNARSLDK